MPAAHPSIRSFADTTSSRRAGLRPSLAATASPVGEPTRTTKPCSNSVNERSKSGRRLRTGLHRDAKTGPRGAGAVDGDQKRILAPSLVVRVVKAIVQKNTILHSKRRKVASAYADECETWRRRRYFADLETTPLSIYFKQRFLGREKKRLERAGSVHHSEYLSGRALHKPIATGLLRIAQRDRQVRHLADLLECNRAIASDRTQDLEPFAP